MKTEELFSMTVLVSWKLVIGRFEKAFVPLTDEQLERQIAPGRNRLRYLLGHLIATNDRMFPLLGLGERLHPNLDEAYISNPDGSLPDPVSAVELKKIWSEVNGRLTTEFEKFTPSEWLQKLSSVSDEDFAKDQSRNRLAVVINRTNHISFHLGQTALRASE